MINTNKYTKAQLATMIEDNDIKIRTMRNGDPAGYEIINPNNYTKASLVEIYEMQLRELGELKYSPVNDKTMLANEIERKNQEIRELKQEIERLERSSKYDDAAAEIKAIHDSFVKAGYTDNQAFRLICAMLPVAIKTAIR